MVCGIVNPHTRAFYADVTCQVYSPCKKYLVAGNIYCELFIYDLSTLENSDLISETEEYGPSAVIQIDPKSQCISLTSTDQFLIVGSKGKIYGYDWKQILSNMQRAPPNPVWVIPLPSNNQMDGVQADALLEVDGSLYAGCSDNNIHVFSLDNGKLVRSLSNHKDYIHDLLKMRSDQITSASEDGEVCFWDLRSSKVKGVIEPWKNANLHRPNLGKWVGCLDSSNDWLVCGGGVKAGLWHLPSMQLTTTFDTDDDGHHVAKIFDGRVLLSGKNKLHQFALTGEPFRSSITTSSSVLYSIAIKDNPKLVISLSGNSPYIDICFTLDYRDTVLSCFK